MAISDRGCGVPPQCPRKRNFAARRHNHVCPLRPSHDVLRATSLLGAVFLSLKEILVLPRDRGELIFEKTAIADRSERRFDRFGLSACRSLGLQNQ